MFDDMVFYGHECEGMFIKIETKQHIKNLGHASEILL